MDQYRKNAEECSRMARNTQNANDRAAWLRLAESWLRMIRPRAGSDERSDNDNARNRQRAENDG